MPKNYKEYYLISGRQAALLRDFYLGLGYNEEQTRRLCSECFGAEIMTDKNERMRSVNWTPPRRTKGGNSSDGGIFSRMFGGMTSAFSSKRSAGRTRAKSSAAMFDDGLGDGYAEARCAPMMAGAMAPVMAEAEAGMPMPMPQAEPEFNTAETEAPKENERTSPLDESQLIFSANVNTASWGYVSERLSTGKEVDPDFVRIEEIINSYGFELKKPEGDAPFELTVEGGKCPWNKDSELMFVGIKGKKADAGVKHNLALLVDVSGSMDDEWLLVQMSVAAIMSRLGKGDVVSVIAYSDYTVTVSEKTDCADRDKLVDIILSIDGIGGCTNGSDGLEKAYKYIRDNFAEDKNNRVFIFTDGDFNFGVTGKGALKDFIYKKRETGIYLSIVGYGMRNFKDDKMEALARNGNGNYTFISNPYAIEENLWKKLESGLITVAKDVKIMIEFNPNFVSEYRLIGYDARRLTKEEFYDTEKAVDGIGSEHEVVALAEIKRGAAARKYKSRYLDTTVKDTEGEFAFVEIHYKTPEGEDKIMTRVITPEEAGVGGANLRKAALLGGFGLLIKDSAYKGDMDKKLLGKLYKAELEAEKTDEPKPYSHLDIISRVLK